MSANKLAFEGLDELREQLRNLPEHLALAAAPIVTEAAERARQDIETAYPERSGNLRGGLKTGSRATSGRYGAAAILRSGSKHAWLYDKGSKPRKTATGANRGSMPASNLFVGFVVRTRHAMEHKLAAFLRDEGFEVSE